MIAVFQNVIGVSSHFFRCALVLLVFLTSSCSRGDSTEMMINNIGTYEVRSQYSELEIIVEDRAGLVAFSAPGLVDFQESSSLRASIYQKWFLYYDSTENELWFHSSDVGLFVWRDVSHNGVFERLSVTNANYQEFEIPGEVMKNLPDSVLKYWKAAENED